MYTRYLKKRDQQNNNNKGNVKTALMTKIKLFRKNAESIV